MTGSLPFTGDELALLQSFADQAVIAIENARLFNETKEALERQTATADILRVISQSPTDVQPVFDAVVLTAQRLLRREMAFILLCEKGSTFRPVAITGPGGLVQILNPEPIPIDPEVNFPSSAIVSKKNLQFPDWSAIELPEEERKIREMYGLNSALYLPMLRGGECIGVLGLGGRQPGNFSETDIALAESFRDQAVIAIENARLFNETQEALERQTATADILKVIASSPSDVQPVFDGNRAAVQPAPRRPFDGGLALRRRYDASCLIYFDRSRGRRRAAPAIADAAGPFSGLDGSATAMSWSLPIRTTFNFPCPTMKEQDQRSLACERLPQPVVGAPVATIRVRSA